MDIYAKNLQNGDKVNMYEKISEIKKREEKVKKLKEKIFMEIEQWLNSIKEIIKVNASEEDFNYCIEESFALLKLKQYLKQETSFMDCEAKYYDEDIIIYTISDKNLSIWLQKDYSFIVNFLCKAEEEEFNIFPLLNDRFFGYQFTNILDSILYDKKKN